MGPIKTEKKTWRKVKEERKKWKEIRMEKHLEKQTEITEEKKKHTPLNNSQISKEMRTCSIAVAGSILENAQSQELRAYLAGQIARAACIYKINEIVIFDDKGKKNLDDPLQKRSNNSCTKFARLLQYLECPQYLRKFFFPLHNDLQYAGIMNPLDAPHHLRQDKNFPFREGVTTDKPVKSEEGTFVNVGLLNEVLIDKSLQPGLRVTVKILPSKKPNSKKLRGVVVSPDTPFNELGTYWGYTVRIAHTLSEVFSKCSYKDGYDLTIGTSDKGKHIDDVKSELSNNYKHCLIVFGGLQGLEAALENDDDFEVEDVSLLFNHYLNTCPDQGSGTIRTEEAVLITLAELRSSLLKS